MFYAVFEGWRVPFNSKTKFLFTTIRMSEQQLLTDDNQRHRKCSCNDSIIMKIDNHTTNFFVEQAMAPTFTVDSAVILHTRTLVAAMFKVNVANATILARIRQAGIYINCTMQNDTSTSAEKPEICIVYFNVSVGICEHICG